jgi:hypothetical protein
MRLAPGIDLWSVRPETLVALMVADGVYRDFGRALVVTSVVRAGAGQLLHARGWAVDLRLPSRCDVDAGGPPVPADALDERVAQALRHALGGPKPGGQCDVLLELGPEASIHWTGAHIHVEFDPLQHPEVKSGL